MDKIICGGFEWERNPQLPDSRMDSGSLFLSNSISQSELAIDTLEANIFSLCKVPMLLSPSDFDGFTTSDGLSLYCKSNAPDITTIPYGTPVEYYRNNVLYAKLYKSEIVREGKAVYALSAISAIGLLDKLPHMGGIYTGQTVSEVLADIIGDSIQYEVAPEVANIKVYGWLPRKSKRNNLWHLLFAVGAAVKKSENGTIVFAFLQTSSYSEIINERIYASGKLGDSGQATGADVTEHTYLSFSTDSEVTLFDNTTESSPADHQTVSFNNPCHDLVPTGITVHESGVNYAIVSGSGTLTGKEYTHQTRIISRRLDTADTENIKEVTDATLVSMANSGAVADRVLSYYSSARPLSSSIVAGDERPGDAVTLEDAFDDVSNGLMESMSIQISSTLKSDSTIIVGYVPENKGNNYNNRIVLTGDGVWEVPEGVESAKCVLIGSGSGGSRGLSGSPGGNVTMNFPGGTGSRSSGPGLGGSGGEAGLPGLGGKIHEVDIALSPGAQITYHTYSGGASGVNPGDAGADGQDSVFGAYSSASGNRSDFGYIDRMSGDILGARGQEGVSGGNGGDGGTTGEGEDGDDVLSWAGGSGNAGWSGPSSDPVGTASIGGGAGSGAAYGSNGLNATGSGTVQSIAAGANGVNASPLPENSLSSYGKGGAGSNGGSGGGGAGRLQITVTQSSLSFTWKALGGTPGLPSIARNGSQGCIVLYY